MNLHLENKKILVTGSSRGIGYAIAECFLKEGCQVTITGRNEKTLNEAYDYFGKKYGYDYIHSARVDLTKADEIKSFVNAVVKHWGNLDILVPNLGTGASVAGWDIGSGEWARMLNINFLSAINMIENLLPEMVGNNKGVITFISSIAGNEVINAPISYAVAKSAINSYMKNLSRLVGKENIRVNAVAPGNVIFPGGTWDRKTQEDEQGVKEYIRNNVPLNRLATPEEIAELVVFISSDRCAFLTGSCIVCDGGQTVGGVY